MDKIKSAFLGFIVGDALGVPVEFKSRDYLDAHPVTGMLGYGSHNQPAGTWSDDTSMTLATMYSIIKNNGINTKSIMEEFVRWYQYGDYTPYGEIFDAGITTQQAIMRFLHTGLLTGMARESNNGNGSLMRMLPILFYWYYNSDKTIIDEVSALTHSHPISCIACELYVSIGTKLLRGQKISQAIEDAYYHLKRFYGPDNKWFKKFNRIPKLSGLTRQDIDSSGYVISTLESALWCLLNSDNFSSAVLKAVNLGGDTDTIAAVTGSLAGIMYQDIPQKWINKLANNDYLFIIIDEFKKVILKGRIEWLN